MYHPPMQRDARRGSSGCGDEARFLLLRSTRERKATPGQKRLYAYCSPFICLGLVATGLWSQLKTLSRGVGTEDPAADSRSRKPRKGWSATIITAATVS